MGERFDHSGYSGSTHLHITDIKPVPLCQSKYYFLKKKKVGIQLYVLGFFLYIKIYTSKLSANTFKFLLIIFTWLLESPEV